eukprot:887277-Prorocentrum_minimum.AAC.1
MTFNHRGLVTKSAVTPMATRSGALDRVLHSVQHPPDALWSDIHLAGRFSEWLHRTGTSQIYSGPPLDPLWTPSGPPLLSHLAGRFSG